MTEYDHYVVIDLEATCCDDGSIRRKDSEIIEIGAVRVDSRTFETVGEFQTFVRPVVHPRLTRFCTELTTITQAQVDGAPRFAEAIEGLSPWFAHGRALFCSWGDYDKNQFEIDARRSKVKLPFGGAHLNVKRAFSARRNDPTLYGNRQALALVGLSADGVHHRGIDDARNIAKLLSRCV
jgi:inhibitor of KinA sporulation pathway (predicted exonuclease)